MLIYINIEERNEFIMIKEKLRADLKEALKENGLKKDVIKALMGKIQDAEIIKREPLSNDEEVVAVRKELKEMEEMLLGAEKAKRENLISETKEKIEIIKTYLPIQMNEDEIRTFIENKVTEMNLDISDKHTLRKVIFPLLKGKADSKLVNKIIAE